MKFVAKKVQNKLLWLLLIILTVISVLFLTTQESKAKPLSAQEIKIDGVYLPKPKDISDFQLTDNLGKPFSKANLKGHWTMMFFGFTNCGMVCPTTLAALNKMYVSLEKDLPNNKLPQVVLVSVDPERDTVSRMNDYVHAFNTHFIGARGNWEQTKFIEKQLNIVAAKMQTDGKGKNHYTINHTAEIMVFNPEAKLQAYLSYPHDAEQMVKDYKLMLKTEVV